MVNEEGELFRVLPGQCVEAIAIALSTLSWLANTHTLIILITTFAIFVPTLIVSHQQHCAIFYNSVALALFKKNENAFV
jgi:hypothetical protein